MNRRTRRLGSGLLNLVLALVSLAALAFIVPAAFGYQRYVVVGHSMTGTYDFGTLVYDEVVPVDRLRVGDVITYVPPAESGIDHLVTHRIVAMHGSTLQTRGDAVGHDDPWTFRLTAATQPRVTFAVPYAGYPLLFLQDPRHRMLLVGVPAGLIFLFALVEVLALTPLRRLVPRSRPRRPASPLRGEAA